MGLNRKIFSILAFIFIFLGLTQWAIQETMIVPSFLRLERKEAVTNLNRAVQAINKELSHLDTTGFDWSSWTDTWEFVQTQNPNYIDSNLVFETFLDGRIHLFSIVASSGKLVWQKIFDPKTMEEIRLKRFPTDKMDIEDPLFSYPAQTKDHREKVVKGLLLTPTGPLMISSRPILHSDGTGPSRGWLIIGRFLDVSILDELKIQTHADFSIIPVLGIRAARHEETVLNALLKQGPHYFKKQENHLEVYTAMSDIIGRPALLVWTKFPRTISRKGMKSVYFALASFVFASLAVMLIMGFMIRRIILNPIQALTRHAGKIQQGDDYTHRLNMERKDEIGELAGRFDAMVTRIEEQTNTLHELAVRDPLTQLANRRLFNQSLDLEWKRLRRKNAPLGLIFCDVDHFKAYNDTCGHPAGDACLSRIAQAIQGSINRPSDLAARYGGEEFVILLPNTPSQGTCVVGENIRKAVESLEIPHPGSNTGPFVTISLGTATIIPGRSQTTRDLIKNADNALYEAKKSGRNKTVCTQIRF